MTYPEIEQYLLDNYGITFDYTKCGYILADGRMVPITHTHREICADLNIKPSLPMELGIIRQCNLVQYREPNFEMHACPTYKQMLTIYNTVREAGQCVYIDMYRGDNNTHRYSYYKIGDYSFMREINNFYG